MTLTSGDSGERSVGRQVVRHTDSVRMRPLSEISTESRLSVRSEYADVGQRITEMMGVVWHAIAGRRGELQPAAVLTARCLGLWQSVSRRPLRVADAAVGIRWRRSDRVALCSRSFSCCATDLRCRLTNRTSGVSPDSVGVSLAVS
jgi:hypothetical protein